MRERKMSIRNIIISNGAQREVEDFINQYLHNHKKGWPRLVNNNSEPEDIELDDLNV